MAPERSDPFGNSSTPSRLARTDSDKELQCNASELLALSRRIEEFVCIDVPDGERLARHKAFLLKAETYFKTQMVSDVLEIQETKGRLHGT